MGRWKLKACPRCGGDLFPDYAQDVWFEDCLQCGYSSVVPESVVEEIKKSNKDNLRQAEKSTPVKQW